MSKMKSWMMDMEEAVVDCIENGASSMSDVLAGVRTAVPICDDKFVMEYVKTIIFFVFFPFLMLTITQICRIL